MLCDELLYKFHIDDDDEGDVDDRLCVDLLINLNNLSN